MKRIVPASSLFAAQRSAGGSPPANVPPTNIAVPVVSGAAQVGSVLTATTGTWAGTSPITYAYQWQRGTTPISGATNATYTVVSGDLGNTLRVVVTATNAAGSASANSANTGTVVNPPASPVNTAAPVVSGTAAQGFQLTVSNGTWTGDPTIVFTYQWVRGATDITGATGATYTLVSADVGQQIRCRVTATNGVGSASANSNQTSAVAAAAITINTPVSPQPSGSPVVVSGTYAGNMTTASTLVWRSGGADVGSPITVPTISGGNWTATITSPAAGTYTLRVTHNLGPTATSNAVTVEAGAATTAANFTLFGSGDDADTVAIFGHSFPEGEVQPSDPVVVQRNDNSVLLRTQMTPLATWPDGTVRTATFAAEMPALAEGAPLSVALRVGEAHPSPGPALTWSAALSGRSVQIRTWAPGNNITPLWTYDVGAALLASGDDWTTGPLAICRRVRAPVPASAVRTTSDGAGTNDTMRLIVDVTATKDGALIVDCAWRNDAAYTANLGIARFGYTIEIDGTIVYDQRPSTGAARDLLFYSWWMRRRGKKGARVYDFYTTYRPLFAPDLSVLQTSHATLPYDVSAVPPIDTSILNGFVSGAGQLANPYWNWGLTRNAGDQGGRPEIGYRTAPIFAWMVYPTVAPRVQLYANIQAETFTGTNSMYADAEFERPILRDEWPQFSSGTIASLGQPRATAQGVHIGAQHNTTDHVTADNAHRGAFYAMVALLEGRRLLYDATAWRAAEVPLALTSYNGGVLYSSPSWRNFSPDHTTGVAWAHNPWEPQIRSAGWGIRDIQDAQYVLPDSYPRRDFYEKNAQAFVNVYHHSLPWRLAALGEDKAQPIIHAGNDHDRPYMTSFLIYGLTGIRRCGWGGPNITDVYDRLVVWRTAGALINAGFARQVLSGDIVFYWTDTSRTTPLSTWADVVASPRNPGIAYPGNGAWTDVGADYIANVINTLAFQARDATSVARRADARDALVFMRSHRPQANTYPRTHPSTWSGNRQTNNLWPEGWSVRWNEAPVLQTPAPFSVPIEIEAGALIGLIDWTGATPRMTDNLVVSNHDSFEIVSQPAGNPFTVSRGGVIRRSATGSLTAGNMTLQVRCRCFDEDGTERWSNTVTVTVNVVAVAPVLSANQTVDAAENAAVGAVVAEFTYTGNVAQTATIVSGNTGNHFSIHLVAGNRVQIRVANALPASPASRTLTITVTNLVATSDPRTCAITIVPPVFAPVWTSTDATVDVAQDLPSGGVARTLTHTGSAATPSVISTDGPFTVDSPSAGTIRILTNAALPAAPATRTATVRIANAAGVASPDIVTTFNIVTGVASTIFDSIAPSAVGNWLWLGDIDRRLVNGYTGPAVRLRRVSDNVEADFGFTGAGALDRAAISAWAPSQEVRVVSIYDQLGGPAMTNATAGSQFQLTNASGVFHTHGTNGRAFMDSPGYSAFMATPSSPAIDVKAPKSTYAMFMAHRQTAAGGGHFRLGTGAPILFFNTGPGGDPNVRQFLDGNVQMNLNVTGTQLSVMAIRRTNSALLRGWRNGTEINSVSASSATGLTANRLGINTGDFANGQTAGCALGNMMLAHTISDADITAVVDNLRVHFGGV